MKLALLAYRAYQARLALTSQFGLAQLAEPGDQQHGPPLLHCLHHLFSNAIFSRRGRIPPGAQGALRHAVLR